MKITEYGSNREFNVYERFVGWNVRYRLRSGDLVKIDSVAVRTELHAFWHDKLDQQYKPDTIHEHDGKLCTFSQPPDGPTNKWCEDRFVFSTLDDGPHVWTSAGVHIFPAVDRSMDVVGSEFYSDLVGATIDGTEQDINIKDAVIVYRGYDRDNNEYLISGDRIILWRTHSDAQPE